MIPTPFLNRMRSMPHLDFDAFCAALDTPAVRALRVNTLKTDADTLLPLLPFTTSPLPFCKDAFYAPEDKVGALPAHHAGMMYMQDPGAISAVAAAAPTQGLRVIDLCAAPRQRLGVRCPAIGELVGVGLVYDGIVGVDYRSH